MQVLVDSISFSARIIAVYQRSRDVMAVMTVQMVLMKQTAVCNSVSCCSLAMSMYVFYSVFGSQTLISETVQRRPIKSVSVVGF